MLEENDKRAKIEKYKQEALAERQSKKAELEEALSQEYEDEKVKKEKNNFITSERIGAFRDYSRD